MTGHELEPQRIPLRTAAAAVVASSLLRAPWFLLLLIRPHSTSGGVVFYLVVASAGIVLLHWCLSWFEWTISFRAAFGARALPGLAAAALSGTLGFHASLRAVGALGVFELLLGIFVVGVYATRPHGWAEFGTGFDEGELLPAAHDDYEPDEDERYTTNVASLVRAARAARVG